MKFRHKLLSGALAAMTLAGSLATAAYARDFNNGIIYDPTFEIGDADGDGTVNMLDLYSVKRYLAGYSDENFSCDAADFDANSTVSMPDLLEMKKLLASYTSQSDYENGKQIYKFTIGGVDISEFSLLLAEDAIENDNPYYAAEGMQRYIRVATGVTLPIEFGESEKSHHISFNKVELDSELGKQFGYEGYSYVVKDGNLDIYGTWRGNMYAVYDILEEYLGWRFFDSSDAFIYKSRTADIPEGTYSENIPQIEFRFCGQNFRNFDDYYVPRHLNGSQYGGHFGYEGDNATGHLTGPFYINAHSFGYYHRMGTGTPIGETYVDPTTGQAKVIESFRDKYNSGEQMQEEHNYYTGAKGWQPCPNDDDEFDILYEGLVDSTRMVIEEWGRRLIPDINCVSFSICDSEDYCQCRDCRVMARTEGYSGMFVNMTNKAADMFQELYPGVSLYMIMYNHTVPETIRPNEHVILMYCGVGCAQHPLGSGECGTNVTKNNTNNNYDEYALKEWGRICKETGAKLWFWDYAVTFNTYVAPCPNIFNIYYDLKYLFECGVTGIYFEGQSTAYNFENMKSYLAARLMWEPDMTYDQYVDYLKEYLYMWFGDGYTYVYDYIVMQNEAGDQSGACFLNNFDLPGEMYSYTYLADHYEEMRGYITKAIETTDDSEQVRRLERILVSCDFMGLSTTYYRNYTNGTAESRKLYEDRYTWMFNYIKNNNLRIATYATVPDSVNFDSNPMVQFGFNNGTGSRRSEVTLEIA